ncbi:MAG TPA: hypothetical protein VEC92_02855 [Nitrososphaerales archaeon]|nr:hypothetical protein [Nitrososphaerales archaeon]
MSSSLRSGLGAILILLLLAGRGGWPSSAAPYERSAAAAAPPPFTVQQYNTTIPSEYQSNYTTLENALNNFNSTLGTIPAHPNSFTYSASLVTADGNQGPKVLTADNQNTVDVNLDAFQAMGLKEVEISIPYPLLDPTFPNSSQYLSYYTQLVQNAHARGMKVLVESHVVFAGTEFSPINYSFANLPYSQFVVKAIAQNQLIIDKVRPDYLDIGTEADTEAALTGYRQLNTPSGWDSFIEQQLSSLNKTGSPTKICAGAGTWNGVQFMQGFADDPRLDFLTTHVYPLYGDNLQTLIQMAQLAQQNGKRLVISEFWSETVTVPSPPPGTGVGGAFADHQEVWGFSSAIDVPALELMVKFASIYPVELFSPFSEQYFFAYLNYTPQLDSEDYSTLKSQVDGVWSQNMRSDVLTPTGAEYATLASSSSTTTTTSSSTTSTTTTSSPTTTSTSRSTTSTASSTSSTTSPTTATTSHSTTSPSTTTTSSVSTTTTSSSSTTSSSVTSSSSTTSSTTSNSSTASSTVASTTSPSSTTTSTTSLTSSSTTTAPPPPTTTTSTTATSTSTTFSTSSSLTSATPTISSSTRTSTLTPTSTASSTTSVNATSESSTATTTTAHPVPEFSTNLLGVFSLAFAVPVLYVLVRTRRARDGSSAPIHRQGGG